MTNKEKQEWLEVKYPLTIIADRYDGTYSGGGWLAFPLYCDEVPSAVDGYDEECAAFWANNLEPVGKGNSAQSAIENLIYEMESNVIIDVPFGAQDSELKGWEYTIPEDMEAEMKDGKIIVRQKESEDERIRKGLLRHFRNKTKPYWNEIAVKDIIAYLEKQKEQKPRWEINNPHITKWTKEMIDEKFEELVEKYHKQKPAEWSETKELVFKDICNHLEVEGYSGWVVLLNALHNGEFQPKPEWSEEDERVLSRCIKSVECSKQFADSETYKAAKDVEINWLKSLRPQPKVDTSNINDRFRYCIEYINPQYPLIDGKLNVRHLHVPDEHGAEMALTIILSFGGKIYALYRGNVKEGKLGEWPTPMIVDEEDWYKEDWLENLKKIKGGIHELSISFMNYLDENRPEGKMSLSNGECEDIDKAFIDADWGKILWYANKYSKKKDLDAEIKKYTERLYNETFGNGQGTLDEFDWDDIASVIEDTARYFYNPQPHWKPSEEQMYSLGTVVKGYDECTVGSVGYNLKSLYEQLKKL